MLTQKFEMADLTQREVGGCVKRILMIFRKDFKGRELKRFSGILVCVIFVLFDEWLAASVVVLERP